MTIGSSLSDEELAELGIKRERGEYGLIYTIPCAVCGRDVHSRAFSTNKVYKCDFCKNRIKEKRSAMNKAAKEEAELLLAEELDTDQVHVHRFEAAAAKFGDGYERNIATARKAIDKYDSAPEVAACIELLHIGARVIVHQKVGDYTVDFCLPDEKVVIEVDGSLYHNDEAKEQMRDYAIDYMLGGGWMVRHVPADGILRKHKTFGAGMRKMLNARREELGLGKLKSKQ